MVFALLLAVREMKAQTQYCADGAPTRQATDPININLDPLSFLDDGDDNRLASAGVHVGRTFAPVDAVVPGVPAEVMNAFQDKCTPA
mmetsp:Transcript_9050/g.21093  ORF Transcript_9050/g.21093 Transcript_9050/m.21093 type:complete len:87 (+) Transcript_9050:91-351(+)